MIGIGTIWNTLGILLGGLIGVFAGRLFDEKQQETIMKTCGISVLFIAIAGAIEGTLIIKESFLLSGR